jgi:SAM-dependent methyltransferase
MSYRTVEFHEDWYRNLVAHSNEKELLVTKIGDLIQGKPHQSCLEIGLGLSPYFAQRLAPLFQDYTIVERRTYDDELPQKVRLINNDWETVELSEKFDVLIASHVVYYFKDPKTAVDKMFAHLNSGGRIFFVVNGKESDYGPLKIAFSKIINAPYVFTYDQLIELLRSRRTREYTAQSSISFDSLDELYEILKISFDAYPQEYQANKSKMLNHLRENVKGNKFFIDQKIIEATA